MPQILHELTKLFSPSRHVHNACDPEGQENNRGRYVCRICKSSQRSQTMAAATSASSNASMSPRLGDDNSNDAEDFMAAAGSGGSAFLSDGFENGRVGIGKGKPMAMGAPGSLGKRGRRGGYGFMARSRGGGNSPGHTSSSSPLGWKGTGMSSISAKQRANEARRRGRQPKVRGMVGLQV